MSGEPLPYVGSEGRQLASSDARSHETWAGIHLLIICYEQHKTGYEEGNIVIHLPHI